MRSVCRHIRRLRVVGFTFDNIDVAAQRAGTIQNAENWKFTNMQIHTADGSAVVVK
jgi:hypothetical protein